MDEVDGRGKATPRTSRADTQTTKGLQPTSRGLTGHKDLVPTHHSNTQDPASITQTSAARFIAGISAVPPDLLRHAYSSQGQRLASRQHVVSTLDSMVD